MDIDDLQQQLKEAREECEKLRRENEKLKAILRSFSLQPASTLKPPSGKHSRVLPSNKIQNDAGDSQAEQTSKATRKEVSNSRPKKPLKGARIKGSQPVNTSISNEMISVYQDLFRGRNDV